MTGKVSMMVVEQLEFGTGKYGIHRATRIGFDEAVRRVRTALEREGFGVLTEIDVKATMKKKLDLDYPRFVILGACNPPLAHRALSAVPDVGLLLPCNVVVRENADGSSSVSAVKPTVAFERLVEAPAVGDVAREAEERLERALDAVSRA